MRSHTKKKTQAKQWLFSLLRCMRGLALFTCTTLLLELRCRCYRTSHTHETLHSSSHLTLAVCLDYSLRSVFLCYFTRSHTKTPPFSSLSQFVAVLLLVNNKATLTHRHRHRHIYLPSAQHTRLHAYTKSLTHTHTRTGSVWIFNFGFMWVTSDQVYIRLRFNIFVVWFILFFIYTHILYSTHYMCSIYAGALACHTQFGSACHTHINTHMFNSTV